jgi:hypothetical protein
LKGFGGRLANFATSWPLCRGLHHHRNEKYLKMGATVEKMKEKVKENSPGNTQWKTID